MSKRALCVYTCPHAALVCSFFSPPMHAVVCIHMHNMHMGTLAYSVASEPCARTHLQCFLKKNRSEKFFVLEFLERKVSWILFCFFLSTLSFHWILKFASKFRQQPRCFLPIFPFQKHFGTSVSNLFWNKLKKPAQGSSFWMQKKFRNTNLDVV